MDIVEKDLSVQQSKSPVILTDDDDVIDLTLQVIVEEFNYMEII